MGLPSRRPLLSQFRQLKIIKEMRLNSQNRERLLGGSDVDIVGESYYSSSFKKLSKFQESSAGHPM